MKEDKYNEREFGKVPDEIKTIAEKMLNEFSPENFDWDTLPTHTSRFEDENSDSYDPTIILTFEDDSELVVENPNAAAFSTLVHLPYF